MSLESYKACSNVGLLELLRLVVGNREDILLARGDRSGCMVDHDKYAEMYRASRDEYEEIMQEIMERLERIHQDIPK